MSEVSEATAYADNREHLRDGLRRLDLLVRRHLAAWRNERGGAGEGGGLYIADAHVDRLLRTDPWNGVRVAAGDRQTDDCTDMLQSLAASVHGREQATASAGQELRLVALADRFGLGRRDVDALLVVLGPELDLKYEKVYAYLQDDLTRTRPSVGLALRIVGGTAGSDPNARPLFTPGSPLLDHRLVRLSGEGPLLSRTVEIDRRIVAYLLGEDALDPALAEIADCQNPTETISTSTAPETDVTPIERLPVTVVVKERLGRFINEIKEDLPAMVHLHGPYGTGRETAVAAICAELGLPLMAANASKLTPELLDAVVREAQLGDTAIHVTSLSAEGESSVTLSTLLERLDDVSGPVFLTGTTPLSARLTAGLDRHSFHTIPFERPSFELRRALWNQIDLPAGVDPSNLASKFRFTAGEIKDAVATARALADGKLTRADIYEGCRAQSREHLDGLAQQVEPSYGWDDIVLPDEQHRRLREVAAFVDHRGQVYDEWGFRTKFSLGTGVNALFAGPSGTGKTMAAEILANETGLDLYKIDLASVVSKYIGETESNLGELFDEADRSNAVLFFDEADALFGERSDVSDAHDRYANIEVDYLLQRMEDHDGVVLLATNLEENIDNAFQRRLNLTVEFPRPEPTARERIWRSSFPVAAPVGDLDWEFLAGFKLTGGNIKTAALTAAMLAAEETDGDASIGMRHAVRAVERELDKSGQLVSSDEFKPYRELLS